MATSVEGPPPRAHRAGTLSARRADVADSMSGRPEAPDRPRLRQRMVPPLPRAPAARHGARHVAALAARHPDHLNRLEELRTTRARSSSPQPRSHGRPAAPSPPCRWSSGTARGGGRVGLLLRPDVEGGSGPSPRCDPIDRSRVNGDRRTLRRAARRRLEPDHLPEGGRCRGWTHPFRAAPPTSPGARAPGRTVYIDGTATCSASRKRPGRPPGGSGTEDAGGSVPALAGHVCSGGPSPRRGEDARRFGARIESSVALLADEAGRTGDAAGSRLRDGPRPAGRSRPWRRSWPWARPGQAWAAAPAWPPR